MPYSRRYLLIGLVPLLAGALFGQALFVKPVKVLGDPHFIGTGGNPLQITSQGPNGVEGRELQSPLGVALDNSVSPPILYIADSANNRVLAYQSPTQRTPGAVADLVIGQPDRFSNLSQGPGSALSTGLNFPTGLAVDASGNLYVADSGNNRVLRYPKPFSQPSGYQFPDFVIGQTSFSSTSGSAGGVKATSLSFSSGSTFGGRSGLAFDSNGNLWVADTLANRVLRYPASVLKTAANGPSADLAVGQTDLVSSVASVSRIGKTGLSHPTGISFDAAGRLFVADGLGRVVVYPPNPGVNAIATRILGVPTQQPGLPPPPSVSEIAVGGVAGLATPSGSVIVADTINSRVLVYPTFDTWPAESTQFSPSANSVVGQLLFSDSKINQGNGDSSASTLNGPQDIAVGGGEVYVADAANNRVLVFALSPAGMAGAATRVIGQLDFPYHAPNLIEGKEFNLAPTNTSASGMAILDFSATPPRLYVSDTANNRILGFSNFLTVKNGQKADLVIGQPDLLRAVPNYPSGNTATPNAQGLNLPTSIVVDSAGNLYVADTGNSRILRFPAPFASGKNTLESADLVLGQPSFTSIVTDATQRTMSAPVALAFTKDGFDGSKSSSGWLVAADGVHNRVLFFPKPFSNGMSANKILGQLTYNATATSADVQRMASPRGVAVDPFDRVLVADTGNKRVQIFGSASILADYATPSVTLSNGLVQPFSLAMGSDGQFWVVDSGQNALLHYPTIDQLPAKNYASDASQPVNTPRSGFVDTYNNLLATDGANRVLYFAPQLSIVNAASYIPGRPLAPGTIGAIFPTVASNIIGGGTEVASTTPLPTTLADTQAIVNGQPSALFAVTPGQINLPLSFNLPTGGTVDLLVVKPSTGQVYGGAEIPLSSASPAFFTQGSTGTGQVSAINNIDGSINSPTNPVARGQYIQLYGTGQGVVINPPPDGQLNPGIAPTPVNPQVILANTIAVPDANVQYSGLAPLLVGVWQVNVLIPSNVQSGNSVPIKVVMNSIPSDNQSPPPTIVTTISIK